MSGSNIVVNANWGPMIINVNDENIGWSIQNLGAWDKDDIDLIIKYCHELLAKKSRIVFYDVGSNIGSHAIPIAKQFGDKIFVRAFEAQLKMFYTLCGNVVLNDADNIVCENVAVSNVKGKTIKFSVPDYKHKNNFGGLELIPAENSDNDSMVKLGVNTAQTVTLDSYNEDVDFIKLDIEGMELLALSGMKRILKESRPICLVEIRKANKEKIVKFFKKFDYIVEEYTEFDWLFFPKENK